VLTIRTARDACRFDALKYGCHNVSHVMSIDAATPSQHGSDVMASLDDEGRESRLVIADISRDDAWVSVTEDDATPLSAWR
jgi:hypothetical protein